MFKFVFECQKLMVFALKPVSTAVKTEDLKESQILLMKFNYYPNAKEKKPFVKLALID
jgi:hypothetical protein